MHRNERARRGTVPSFGVGLGHSGQRVVHRGHPHCGHPPHLCHPTNPTGAANANEFAERMHALLAGQAVGGYGPASVATRCTRGQRDTGLVTIQDTVYSTAT